MNIQLIEGRFELNDSLDLITQMIHIKIRFHENKISTSENEEDVKAREIKIKRLQKNLFELRKILGSPSNGVKLNATINIEPEYSE